MTDSPPARLAASRARATRLENIRSSPASTGSRTSPATRRTSSASALAAGYPGLHELVEERIFPFVQQVVGFLGIGFPDQNNCTTGETQTDDQQNVNPSQVDGGPIATGAVAGAEGCTPGATGIDTDNGRTYADDLQASTSYDDCTGAGEEKLGRIQFSIGYNSKDMVLTLKVMRAAELAAKDFSGTSDPYVKIMLLPDKKHKLQTNVKRKNLNPRWNETFAFEGFPYAKLISRTLYLQVFDYDRFSRDDPIGEVCLPLSEIDLSKVQTMWKTLQPCKGHVGKLGELLVSLNYQPSVGVIAIGIIKARNLKAKDINGLSDPYVKIWLTHEGKKVEKKKTPVKDKTLNPVFEETIMFTVPYEKIRQTSLIISVMDYDKVGRNEPIGQLVLGSKSGPMEVKHWNEMFAKTRTDVVKWHLLKDLS